MSVDVMSPKDSPRVDADRRISIERFVPEAQGTVDA
jgi:hypothetical protein